MWLEVRRSREFDVVLFHAHRQQLQLPLNAIIHHTHVSEPCSFSVSLHEPFLPAQKPFSLARALAMSVRLCLLRCPWWMKNRQPKQPTVRSGTKSSRWTLNEKFDASVPWKEEGTSRREIKFDETQNKNKEKTTRDEIKVHVSESTVCSRFWFVFSHSTTPPQITLSQL